MKYIKANLYLLAFLALMVLTFPIGIITLVYVDFRYDDNEMKIKKLQTLEGTKHAIALHRKFCETLGKKQIW